MSVPRKGRRKFVSFELSDIIPCLLQNINIGVITTLESEHYKQNQLLKLHYNPLKVVSK